MRVLLGWAWTYLIVAELIGVSSGITYFINQQARYRNFDNVYAAIAMIGIIGFSCDLFLAWLGTVLFPWKRKSRSGPSPWTWLKRSPSVPGLGSSVTSKRSMPQARRALARRAAVPTGPVHEHSALIWPGAASCAVQSSTTRASRTPEMAHSTCGLTAGGDEWT